ncbi:DUF2970 domain-containing protein [Bowmanella dokdonensis]|uniref:DUF2970 domain-containing protein n=1 Tax=Bowmanella dokdonensis TaxID=751969 RepID=A0A939DJS0_9ALTE|nr:DUF2970 domain-containing protein [Bowmanella dokdonensis]MBN7823809.1 DUF2970 domain-containing protein [Bowmanella dokdonensis]
MPDSKPSWFQIFKSVAASAFGVQSDKNRQQDFAHHSALPFLLVGVLFVVLFVVSLILLVNSLV